MASTGDAEHRRAYVVVEPNHTGHRLWYVRVLAVEALATGRPVILISTPEAQRSEEWAVHLAGLPDMEVRTVARSRNWRRSLLKAAGDCTPATVVIPDGERWLGTILATRIPGQVSLLLMRPDAQAGRGGRLRWLVKRSLAALAQAHPNVCVFALSMHISSADATGMLRIPRVPDPVEVAGPSSGKARLELGIRQGESLTLLIGADSARKGIGYLLQAWAQEEAPSVRLAVIGLLGDGIRAVVESLTLGDPRVTIVDRCVSAREFDRWVAAADRVVILSEHIGSSGVALKAWALGTPVVCWHNSFLERELIGLGASFTGIPTSDWLDPLRSLLAHPPIPVWSRLEVEPWALEERSRTFARHLLGLWPASQSEEPMEPPSRPSPE